MPLQPKPTYPPTLLVGHPLYSSIVAIWPFTEGSGTIVHDASVNAFNSVSVTGLDWTTVPTKVTLDGSTSYINFGTNNTLGTQTIGQDRSFEIKFRINTVTNGVTQRIISRMRGPYPPTPWEGYEIYILPPDDLTNPNKIVFLTANFLLAPFTLFGPTLSVGVDYHVIVTQSHTGAANFYVNGTSISSTSMVNPNANAQNLNLGRFPAGGSFFSGVIDKVAIYSAALTSSDVTSLYIEPWQQFLDPSVPTFPRYVSNASIDIMQANSADMGLRLSQLAVEAASVPTLGSIRVSQIVIEYAKIPINTRSLRVSQIVIELPRHLITSGTGWQVKEI